MKKGKICYLIILTAGFLLFILKSNRFGGFIFLLSLIYGITAAVWVFLPERKVQVTGFGGGMVEKNEKLTEGFSIRNDSKIPLSACNIKGHVSNRLTGDIENIDFAVSLRYKQEKKHYIEIKDEFCGRVDVTAEKIVVSDPLYIFEKEIRLGSTSWGYILPKISRATISDEYLNSYDMESYMYSHYEKGSDMGEVFGIREYTQGDSLKSMHWKLSAKMDELMVKIPSFPIENNIIVMLDNVYSKEYKPDKKQRNDLVELFYSLSNELLEKNLPHSIGYFDVQLKEFKIEKIGSREKLINSVPECLSSGFAENEYSIAEEYIKTVDGMGFGNHFLVTGNGECEIEKLENYGEVKIFRAK
ncbi:MAG: DUF58 domain-containing protein [Hornefia sp.]|nr:DUF58 domain-containing protein [Hornefia sp.]